MFLMVVPPGKLVVEYLSRSVHNAAPLEFAANCSISVYLAESTKI
jgi:hypothetical protein